MPSAIQGFDYTATILLSDRIKHTYRTPDAVTVKADDNAKVLTVTLDRIPETSLRSTIVDKTGNTPVAGATVSATQVFGTDDKTTFTVKTDSKGVASISGPAADTELSIVKDGYITAAYSFSAQEMLAAIASAGSTIDVGKLYLEPVAGASLNITVGYMDNEGNRTEHYPNLQDIILVLKSGDKELKTSFTYPTLVITDSVDPTETLTLSVLSKSRSFNTVCTPCTLGQSDVCLTIKEKGAMSISSEGDGYVIAYNKDGELVAQDTPKSGTTIFNRLDDGEYTIVGLRTDDAGKWASLSLLSEAGLKPGTDYTAATAECASGSVSSVNLGSIPASDAAMTIYTGSATSVALNKNVSTIGNNVTLNAYIDFASEYSALVQTPELTVKLPAGVRFIPNSVLANNKQASYSYDAATCR